MQLTPQQAMALAFRGFDPAKVEVKPIGASFVASVAKETDRGIEFLAILERSPEVAVHQLTRLAVRP